MDYEVNKCTLKEIGQLRHLFLQENNFQVRYNACHERNWSDSYLVSQGGASVGYASVKGKDILKERDSIFEFYVIPPYRLDCRTIFSKCLSVSAAKFIESQTNVPLLTSMLYEFSSSIRAETVLFQEGRVTDLANPGVTFRRRENGEPVFRHYSEPVGDYVLVQHGEIVATGGFMLHYNFPFADLYMEVREDCRRNGFASYLLQEIKKECYLHGRIPAARCAIGHAGSQRALLRAGLVVAGYMLTGDTKGQ